MKITAAENLVTESINFYRFSPFAIAQAKQTFADLQKQGVINRICRFDDERWVTTNECCNVGLMFAFDRDAYMQNYSDLFDLSYDMFVDCVKAFILSIFGRRVLITMQSLLADIRRLIVVPPSDIYGVTSKIKLSLPNLCGDFLAQLPSQSEALDNLIEAMDLYAECNVAKSSKQRTLAEFETYFMFDEYLKRFWKAASSAEKLFYYPLYLWWIITAIIPLRPKEFLVTERKCLIFRDGEYYLRLRRTKLKGGKNGKFSKSVSYTIAGDYFIDVYKVPAYVGLAIQEYLDLTENFPDTELKTLFRTTPHYGHWDHAVRFDSRFLTRVNMNTILRYFYEEILQEKFGLRVVCLDDGVHLAPDEISRIHIGDTRHLSLINLMHSGGTPMLAMYLAGHKNTSTSAHYYSNIKTLVECQTYLFHHNLLSEGKKMQIIPRRPLPSCVTDPTILPDGTFCYSSKYKDHIYTDCLKSIGDNGEIGYCPTCSLHRDKNMVRSANGDIYKRQLKEDCKALQEAIEIVRSDRGCIEEVGEALLKLQNSSYSYEMFLREKLAEEDDQ